MTRLVYKFIDVIGVVFSCKRENHTNFPFVKGHLKFFMEYSDTFFERGVALRWSDAHNGFHVGCWDFPGFPPGHLGLVPGVPGAVQSWVEVTATEWPRSMSQWHQTMSVPISPLPLVLIGTLVGSLSGVTESNKASDECPCLMCSSPLK